MGVKTAGEDIEKDDLIYLSTVTFLNGGIARCNHPNCKDPYILEDERHWHKVEADDEKS